MNNYEIETLKTKVHINSYLSEIFDTYSHVFGSNSEIQNYSILFSCIDFDNLNKYLQFYQIHLANLNLISNVDANITFKNIDTLIDSDEKMKLFIFCFHYYF